MKLTHLASAAAAIALMGGVAYAQPAEPAPAPDQQKPADTTPAPPPADTATTPSTTPSTEAAPPPAAAPSTTPPADASAAAATGASTNTATFANLTTANAPIPDTPENRKKYGKPLSGAGKKSAAKGN